MTTLTQNYTREKLIEICERAFVPQDKWRNRDTAISQIKLGSCLALLKAGCHFEIQTEGYCITDERTIWIQFWVKDFMFFEGHDSDPRGRQDSDYHFYLPTEQRLETVNGNDWY